MAWLGLDRLLLGTDLDAEQARSAALDAKITAANRQLEARGAVPAGYSDLAAQDISAGNESTGATDVFGSVEGEFTAGAREGLSNALAAPGRAIGFIGDSSGALLAGILKGIPWWLYLAAAGALFVWLGGLTLLRGSLARR